MKRELVTKLRAALPGLQHDLVFADIAAPMIEGGILAPEEYRQLLARATDSSRAKLLVELLAGKEDAAYETFLDVLMKDYSWLVEEVRNGASCSGMGDVTDSVPFERPEIATNQNLRNQCLELERAVSPSCCRKRCGSPSVSSFPSSSKRSLGNSSSSLTLETDPAAVIIKCGEQNKENAAVETRNKVSAVENSKLSQGITEEMMTLVKKNHRTSRDWTSLAHALGLTRLVNKIRIKVLVFGEDLDVCVLYLLQEWVGNDPKVATLLRLLQALRAEGFNDVADELVEKFAT